MSNRFIETSWKASYNVKQVVDVFIETAQKPVTMSNRYVDVFIETVQKPVTMSNRCIDMFIETSAKAGYNVKQVRRPVYRDQHESRLQCQTGA